VAVRVRPFNSREKAANAQLILKMEGDSTVITNPEDNTEKKFAFDHSYWSHDHFEELADGYLEPTDPVYADQKRVFADLGQGVLDNAWNGYNASLMAYGQTGSGKSYSMVGYGVNKGIVPVTCEQLFKQIESKNADNIQCQVTFSMLEIYNEQVRDLLSHQSVRGGMKVRQHPKKGFYVEGLRVVPVGNYADIEARIEEGTKNRTIAATNMNATSSRAHTIVTINFAQKAQNADNVNMTKSSSINLVDLAGSERAESTGATGDRLKEGAAINQSLSTLGNVISALVDVQNGDRKKIIPFRDSVLTRLLKNALGGNSKTVMIAALSPADINYDETLSTLRFADRVKSIKTQAVVNETPTERLIRELKEENARLMEMLKAGKLPAGMMPMSMDGSNSEMEEQLRRQMDDNRRLEEEMAQWEKRLQEAKEEKERAVSRNSEKEKRKQVPHFWNMNADPALSGVVAYFLEQPTSLIGNGKANEETHMILKSVNVVGHHAEVTLKDDLVFLKKMSKRAHIMHNGIEIGDDVVELKHHDRLLFAPGQLYCLSVPKASLIGKTLGTADDEIARHNGLTAEGEMSPEQQLLQSEIVEMVPHVAEASAMAEELGKPKVFEIEAVSEIDPETGRSGKAVVKILVTDTESGASWLWSPTSFLNRKYAMQEMYSNFTENDPEWDRAPDSDPFYEPFDRLVTMGFCTVYLRNLMYLIEVEQAINIINHRGEPRGKLAVEVVPCDVKGKQSLELDDIFIESPEELLDQRADFLIKFKLLANAPGHFDKAVVHCDFFGQRIETAPVRRR
ncbi:uncharacterized protein MONBRDRAFT_14025, partial [Monosiga brevicollis MX1]